MTDPVSRSPFAASLLAGSRFGSGLVVALALVSCGSDDAEPGDEEQPPVLHATTRVIHLTDHVEQVGEIQSAFGGLTTIQDVSVEVVRPENDDTFWSEAPCPAFTSSLIPWCDGEPLERRASREELADNPGFVLVPATQRVSFKDLRRKETNWHKGDRTTIAYLGFTEQSTGTHKVEWVSSRLELRVHARAAVGAEGVELQIRGGPTASIPLSRSKWETHTITLDVPTRDFSLVFQGTGTKAGVDDEFVNLQWFELHWPQHDRVLIHDDREGPFTLHFAPIPPASEQTLAVTTEPPFRATLLRTGGPAFLRCDGGSGLTIGGVARDITESIDLAELNPGLHQSEFESPPTELVCDQPLAKFVPFLIDPNLELEPAPGEEVLTAPTREALRKVRRRLECRGDRRAALLLPRESHIDYAVDFHPGDELRFAVGGHDRNVDMHGTDLESSPSAEYRVLFQPTGSERWQTLDETTWSLKDETWSDRSVTLPPDLAGRGTVRFECRPRSDHPTFWASAFADPRIVRPLDSTRSRPNVLLYLVDTLRSDRLSCYGHTRSTSPVIDELANDGFLFENCYAVASWTRPSVGSIFSGVYPRYHGATGDHGSALTTMTMTLAETLAEAEYSTWAIVSNNQVAARGLAFEQGFHRFVCPSGMFSLQGQLTSTHIYRTLEPWLETNGDEPFFLYLHSLDPHGPYHPPGEYFDRFTDGYDGFLRNEFLDTVRVLRPLSDKIQPPDVEYVKSVYDAAIKYQDDQFQRLFDLLRHHSLFDNTIVMIISDHGEEFFEHGDWDHAKRLWEELVRVPLIVWVPEGLRDRYGDPRRITSPVSHVDITPSLLEMLEIDDLGTRQGISFVDLMRGQEAEPRTIYASEGSRGMVLQGSDKLIWHFATKKHTNYHLFQLGSDPGELDNLAEKNPELLQELLAERDRLEAEFDKVGSHLIGTGRTVELDDEAKRQLEKLGYMDE